MRTDMVSFWNCQDKASSVVWNFFGLRDTEDSQIGNNCSCQVMKEQRHLWTGDVWN